MKNGLFLYIKKWILDIKKSVVVSNIRKYIEFLTYGFDTDLFLLLF